MRTVRLSQSSRLQDSRPRSNEESPCGTTQVMALSWCRGGEGRLAKPWSFLGDSSLIHSFIQHVSVELQGCQVLCYSLRCRGEQRQGLDPPGVTVWWGTARQETNPKYAVVSRLSAARESLICEEGWKQVRLLNLWCREGFAVEVELEPRPDLAPANW